VVFDFERLAYGFTEDVGLRAVLADDVRGRRSRSRAGSCPLLDDTHQIIDVLLYPDPCLLHGVITCGGDEGKHESRAFKFRFELHPCCIGADAGILLYDIQCDVISTTLTGVIVLFVQNLAVSPESLCL
jgi:hypothetical protein